MTLRRRLFVAIAATLVAVLVVLVIFTLLTEKQRSDRAASFHLAARDLAASLVANVAPAAHQDTLLVRDGRLHDSLSSLGVYRVLPTGEPELHQSLGALAEDEEVRAQALRLVRDALRTEKPAAERDAIAVQAPRIGRGEAAGRPAIVYVAMRPLAIDPVSASQTTYVVIVVAGFLLLGVTYFIVERLVARPLADVVRGAQRVADGDYSRPVPRSEGDDEIQQVIDSFNSMMLELGMLHERMQDRIGEALRSARQTQESLVIAQRLAATGTLAAGIAHEVNNPLGGMLNAVHSLRTKDMSPERCEEYLELVDEGLRRIQATVAKILQFTPHKVAPQPMDVNSVVEPVLALARHRIGDQDVSVEFTASETPALVFGDFYELQQALLNVVLNALDALEEVARDDPSLLLSTDVQDDEVRLLVRDNGPGMDPEDLPHAFDLFFTTKEQGRGSGLGLGTVHKIIDDHGGRVELRPRAGEGMDVLFVLPLLRS